MRDETLQALNEIEFLQHIIEGCETAVEELYQRYNVPLFKLLERWPTPPRRYQPR